MCMQYESFENTMGKGEIAWNEQFLLFPQCFLSIWRFLSHVHKMKRYTDTLTSRKFTHTKKFTPKSVSEYCAGCPRSTILADTIGLVFTEHGSDIHIHVTLI